MFMNSAAQRGFTLIELIIFMVVVAAGLAGILSVMNNVVKSSADPMVRKQAMALADSILEEILLKSYAHDVTVAVGTDRSTFDNVDDFNGLTQAAFADLPAELSGYAIAIAVAPALVKDVTLKKVTVTVSRGRESISMTGYRANY
jgi:MSHA pilin protein MshD